MPQEGRARRTNRSDPRLPEETLATPEGAPQLPASAGSGSGGTASGADPDGRVIVIRFGPGVLETLVIVAVGLIAGLWATGAIHLPAVPNVEANASLWLIFVTGVTAGGLSCLAVQGGLLATSIAQREQRLIEAHVEDRARTVEHAAPILLFLGAKLAAYVMLGAILGLLGSFIVLSPTMRGLLQISIGIFMFGVAMQMLNVHPFFRYFALEPPKRAQRMIRRYSKRDDLWTPLFLGALTVLIPCGVTQAMMLVAIASGSAIEGALIMGAFVLGTSPVFFILGLLATRLSSAMHGTFLKLAAATVAALAILSIVTGYHLLPISGGTPPQTAGHDGASLIADPNVAVGTFAGGLPGGRSGVGQTATINVQAHGYEPPVVQIKAGLPAKINLVTNNVYGCTRAFVIPSLNIQTVLQATGSETVDIPAAQPGRIAYTCSMGMYSGVIEVVQ